MVDGLSEATIGGWQIRMALVSFMKQTLYESLLGKNYIFWNQKESMNLWNILLTFLDEIFFDKNYIF
jgi:hypothetical protein